MARTFSTRVPLCLLFGWLGSVPASAADDTATALMRAKKEYEDTLTIIRAQAIDDLKNIILKEQAARVV
jgi:hypothetical protein